MLLDIELSWQGMERERRLVDRISHFLVKSGQVFLLRHIANSDCIGNAIR
jgi:hypothetical protein